MGKTYIDRRGFKYRVMPGKTGNHKVHIQRPESQGEHGWKAVSSMPWRAVTEEAEKDLEEYAARKQMREWEGR